MLEVYQNSYEEGVQFPNAVEDVVERSDGWTVYDAVQSSSWSVAQLLLDAESGDCMQCIGSDSAYGEC